MRKKMALMSVDEASMYLREVIYIPPHQIRLLAREGKCTFCSRFSTQAEAGRTTSALTSSNSSSAGISD